MSAGAYCVENAIGAELDGILSRVDDPATRSVLLEEDRSVPHIGS